MIYRAQELRESRGGRPGLPVPNSPYGLRGRKATLNFTCCPECTRLSYTGAITSKMIVAASPKIESRYAPEIH